MKIPNKTVVATAGNALLSLRSGSRFLRRATPLRSAMKKTVLTLVAIFAFSGVTEADEIFSDRLLRSLYERSDLIIDATLVENCEGGIGSGPIPTAEAQITLLGCTPRVKINRVLKGDFWSDKPIYVGITIPYSDKVPPEFLQKDERYIFFLEDRPKREPKSHHAVGNEIVRFRSFDLWFWRLPVGEAITIQFSRWKQEQK